MPPKSPVEASFPSCLHAANLWNKNEMYPGVHVHLRRQKTTQATLVLFSCCLPYLGCRHLCHPCRPGQTSQMCTATASQSQPPITSEHFWTPILASTAPCHLCRPSFPFHRQMASLNKMDGCVLEALVYIRRFVASALLQVTCEP